MTERSVEIIRILDGVNPSMNPDEVLAAAREHEVLEATLDFRPTPVEQVRLRRDLLAFHGYEPESWTYWGGGHHPRRGRFDGEFVDEIASKFPLQIETLVLQGFITEDEYGVYPKISDDAAFVASGYSIFIRKKLEQLSLPSRPVQ